jgi:hypothetical protein
MAKYDAYGATNDREEALRQGLIQAIVWWVTQLDDTHNDVNGSSYRELQARAEMARLAREFKEYTYD